MKKYVIFIMIGLLFFSAGLAFAAKPNFMPAVVLNPAKGEVKNTITVPEHAIEVAPGLHYLGTALDGGRVVEGYAFIHYKDRAGKGKPAALCNNNGVCEPGENAKKCPKDCGGDPVDPGTSGCYEFLAAGAKWKTVEPYYVNATNTRGLDQAAVAGVIAQGIDKWESAAGGADIIGLGLLTTSGIVDGLDGLNTVHFGNIDDSNVIGITTIWGIFGGKPSKRMLVEWDHVYNEVNYDWSLSGEAGKMDFDNIATHELGHSFGMGDLYTSECSEMTMYGYATEGETKKGILGDGDITGINALY